MRSAVSALLLGCAMLCGCSHTPDPASTSTSGQIPTASAAAQDAALTALTLIGTPYRFGGASPSGFDCSGLVQYSFRVAGITLPRDTKQQRATSKLLDSSAALAPGDLLFFSIGSASALHVGLFVGEGKFVHAPSEGGRVRIEKLDTRYWRRHFIEARRP